MWIWWRRTKKGGRPMPNSAPAPNDVLRKTRTSALIKAELRDANRKAKALHPSPAWDAEHQRINDLLGELELCAWL